MRAYALLISWSCWGSDKGDDGQKWPGGFPSFIHFLAMHSCILICVCLDLKWAQVSKTISKNVPSGKRSLSSLRNTGKVVWGPQVRDKNLCDIRGTPAILSACFLMRPLSSSLSFLSPFSLSPSPSLPFPSCDVRAVTDGQWYPGENSQLALKMCSLGWEGS